VENIIVKVCFIVVLAALIFAPSVNEDWLDYKLNLAFMEFKGTTQEKYPDKTTRETAFAKVLAEKARIVKENSWPLMVCEATFTARNPGTIHRKNVRAVSCSWGS